MIDPLSGEYLPDDYGYYGAYPDYPGAMGLNPAQVDPATGDPAAAASPQIWADPTRAPLGPAAPENSVNHPKGTYPAGTPGAAPSGPPTLNPNDDASIDAFIAYWAGQPGANPSLKNDPGYWKGQIKSGHLGTDQNYIISKFLLPEGAPAGAEDVNTGNYLAPFTEGFVAPPTTNGAALLGAPPQYQAPPYDKPPAFEFPDFVLPNEQTMQEDPGFQWRLKMGQKVLEGTKAYKGTYRSGATQKALMDYGQGAASQEYGNIVTRAEDLYGLNRGNALGKYNTNYQTQYTDPYSYLVDAAKTQNSNDLIGWQSRGNAALNDEANAYQRARDEYLTRFDIFKSNQDRPWNKLTGAASQGISATAAGG